MERDQKSSLEIISGRVSMVGGTESLKTTDRLSNTAFRVTVKAPGIYFIDKILNVD
jgi:hypothetical protein